MKQHHWSDSGYKSRKMWFAVFAIGVLFVGMVFVINHGAAIGLYDAFVGGVVGVAGLFIAGNVGAKLAATKVPPQTTTATPVKKVAAQKVEEPELPEP
jgi:hypothetical protein